MREYLNIILPKPLIASRWLVILIAVIVSGCNSGPQPETTVRQRRATQVVLPSPATATPVQSSSPTQTASLPSQQPGKPLALTHQRLDGNRLADGNGTGLQGSLEIPLSGKPIWVVGATFQEGTIWAVALEGGQVQVFQTDPGGWFEEIGEEITLPPGMPPALVIEHDAFQVLPPPPHASVLSHPVLLPDETLVYIRDDGKLGLLTGDESLVVEVDALPDARILSDDMGRLMFLSRPTTQYPHGVLGDTIEAQGITWLDTRSRPITSKEILIPEGDVIEGIAPIWVDMDGDGSREIVVTQSNPQEGARIVIYREDGSVFAESRSIGQGFRWTHLIAVGQFVEGGSLEVATVRTPHIGGVVEIYSLIGNQLVIQAELDGYSSHQIGSRNLDGAVAMDLDADGQYEVIVPDQEQTSVAAIQLADGRLQAAWAQSLQGKISTNIAASKLPDGGFALGLGLEENVLKIWFFR
jgi:hypothetical protein